MWTQAHLLGVQVADTALLLDVLQKSSGVGWEPSAVPPPPSPPEGGFLFCVEQALLGRRDLKPRAIAWSPDCGGLLLAVDPEIRDAVRRAGELLAAATGESTDRATR